MILILAFTYFAVRVNAVGIVSTASPTSLTDGSEEYVIAVRSPNISVVDVRLKANVENILRIQS